MKKLISMVLVIMLILTQISVFADDFSLGEYVNNEVFVVYSNGTTELLTYNSQSELEDGLNELSNNPNVKIFQPNYTYTNNASKNDELYSKQWAYENDGSFYMEEQKNEFPVFESPFGNAQMPGQWKKPDNFGRPGGNYRMRSYTGRGTTTTTAKEGIDINISEAWDSYTDSGKEVIVAMVDTGIDYSHKDLEGNIWINTDEIANNGIDDDQNGYVDDVYGWNFYNNNNKVYTGSDDDHGTHGAGTIVATGDNEIGVSGINQSDNVKVMSVKALGGNNGSGSTASVIKAILYAEANGASICNLSLGSENNDKALYETIKNSNMLFVVASGNDGKNTDSSPSYPASYDLDNIISVANLNYDGNLNYSSNYGEKTVDIAAPGSYILSTTTNNAYSYMSGTSMSAPFVSGAAAMIYSNYEDISLADVKEIILNSAKKLDSLEGVVATGGMLDLGSALNYDLDKLSGEEWEYKDSADYTGTKPVINAQIINSQNKSYLIVEFSDEDDDIECALYEEGEYDADYFEKGENGNKITLNNNGIATFEASDGTFTFYAIDSNGNETTQTFEITTNRGNNKNMPNRDFNDRMRNNPMPMPNFPQNNMNDFFGGMERMIDRMIMNQFGRW